MLIMYRVMTIVNMNNYLFLKRPHTDYTLKATESQ